MMICAIMNTGSNLEFINGIFRNPFLEKLGAEDRDCGIHEFIMVTGVQLSEYQ